MKRTELEQLIETVIRKVLNEDFLICTGGNLDDFLKEIKPFINDYELKNDTLKFIISGDENTVKKYTDIGKKYNVTCKFEY